MHKRKVSSIKTCRFTNAFCTCFASQGFDVNDIVLEEKIVWVTSRYKVQ